MWPQYSIPPYHLISSLQSDLGSNTTLSHHTLHHHRIFSLSLSPSRLGRSQLLPGHVVPLKPQYSVRSGPGHHWSVLPCYLSYQWWQDRGCLVKMLGALSNTLYLHYVLVGPGVSWCVLCTVSYCPTTVVTPIITITLLSDNQTGI